MKPPQLKLLDTTDRDEDSRFDAETPMWTASYLYIQQAWEVRSRRGGCLPTLLGLPSFVHGPVICLDDQHFGDPRSQLEESGLRCPGRSHSCYRQPDENGWDDDASQNHGVGSLTPKIGADSPGGRWCSSHLQPSRRTHSPTLILLSVQYGQSGLR